MSSRRVEGTLSQGVRAFGLRRSRYLGLAKTHLQHMITAGAMNLARLAAWFTGVPPEETRTSRFARLKMARSRRGQFANSIPRFPDPARAEQAEPGGNRQSKGRRLGHRGNSPIADELMSDPRRMDVVPVLVLIRIRDDRTRPHPTARDVQRRAGHIREAE